jgi:hypothetical protein
VTQQGDASRASVCYPLSVELGVPPKVKTQPLFAAGSTSPDGAMNKQNGIAWGDTAGLFVVRHSGHEQRQAQQ